MSNREAKLLVGDILDAISKIESYLSGSKFEDFIKDDKTIDAVIRNFGIIGEAANRLPDEYKGRHDQIDWIQIVGLRNRVIHDYFGVDLEIIWYISKNELEDLKTKLSGS